ncbi:MAG: nucleotidyltransferase family protein [Leptolyngbyaceae cyanobacterium SM1_3_5]|nr:nucleotidyltransferase family protein [Leptolyngbyaceae cyanobacterium SM1_3_5]
MQTELQALIDQRLQVDRSQIVEFCDRWKITEFALFGSVLRDDFRPDSDIDVLVTFAPNSRWSLLNWVDMKAELEAMFKREVDIVEKKGLTNPYRRYEILKTHQVVYTSEQP